MPQSALNRRNEGKKTTTDIALSIRVNPFCRDVPYPFRLGAVLHCLHSNYTDIKIYCQQTKSKKAKNKDRYGLNSKYIS